MDNFDKAEKFYNENKDNIIKNFIGTFTKKDINYEAEFDEVYLKNICFQNSDMNGNSRFEANYRNYGADYGFYELVKEIISEYREIEAIGEVHNDYFAIELASEICENLFNSLSITSYFNRSKGV